MFQRSTSGRYSLGGVGVTVAVVVAGVVAVVVAVAVAVDVGVGEAADSGATVTSNTGRTSRSPPGAPPRVKRKAKYWPGASAVLAGLASRARLVQAPVGAAWRSTGVLATV